MNCKPGDLAVVSGPGVQTPGLRGRFVIVERRELPSDEAAPGLRVAGDDRIAWLCRSAASGGKLPVVLLISDVVIEVERRVIADSILRPIRPNEGEDESLSWARPKVEERV